MVVSKTTTKHYSYVVGCHMLIVVPDLEATRNRLLDSEREKAELATQYQQRLEQVEHLKR